MLFIFVILISACTTHLNVLHSSNNKQLHVPLYLILSATVLIYHAYVQVFLHILFTSTLISFYCVLNKSKIF
jgi:hypothetical protein